MLVHRPKIFDRDSLAEVLHVFIHSSCMQDNSHTRNSEDGYGYILDGKGTPMHVGIIP